MTRAHVEFGTLYIEIHEDVTRAARATASSWPDVIEADDAEQEIWLNLLETSEKNRTEIYELDEGARFALLKKMGSQIAQGYRDDYELFHGNFYYGTEHVREILDGVSLFSDEPQDVNPGSETATERADLKEALEVLYEKNPQYAVYIEADFRDNDPIHDHPEKLKRSIDALTKEMNRSHNRKRAKHADGPGTRKIKTRWIDVQ